MSNITKEDKIPKKESDVGSLQWQITQLKNEKKEESYQFRTQVSKLKSQIKLLEKKKKNTTHYFDSNIKNLELQIEQLDDDVEEESELQEEYLEKNNFKQKINIFLSIMFITGIILAVLYILIIKET